MKGEHQHTDAMGILFWSLLVLAVAIGYAVISAQGRSHRTITLQSLNISPDLTMVRSGWIPSKDEQLGLGGHLSPRIGWLL